MMVAVIINGSAMLGVTSTFAWSWNPKIGMTLFLFLISYNDLREPCSGNSYFLIRSPSIAFMTKTEGDLELEDFEVF